MEIEKEKIKVNDGGGLLDEEGLIDSLIIDCNNAVKAVASGEYIGWCGISVQMVQKLSALKKGITADIKSRDKQIEELKKINDELRQRIIGYQKEEVSGDV